MSQILKNKDKSKCTPVTPVSSVTQVSLMRYISQTDSHTINNTTKKRKKTSGENPPGKKHNINMSIENNTQNVDQQNVHMQNTMDHWEKYFEALESRLSASITENVTANVNKNFNTTILGLDTTLKTAMKTMTTAVNGLIKSNKTMIQHKVVMDDLTQENQALSVHINRLETEHLKLRDKFNQFESKDLEHCILMHGIEEEEDEDEAYLREQAYYELSSTIDHYDENERWRQIKQMEILRCKQIGRYNCNKPRTVSIEFQH